MISSELRNRTAVSKRRSSIEIIADMLKIGENGAGKTKIMYNANMSFSQIQKYLRFLVGQGFIDKVEVENTGITYQMTESGSKLLDTINNLIEMLGLNEDDKFK